MSHAVRDEYAWRVRALLDLPATRNTDNEIEPGRLLLSPPALEELFRFKATLEPRLGPDGDLGTIADWGNKLTGTVARLAGILHAADRVGAFALQPPTNAGQPTVTMTSKDLTAPIEAEVVKRAITVADYGVKHAQAAFGLMGTDPATELAKHVLSWVKRTKADTFTRRDVHRGMQGRVKQAQEFDQSLEILEERVYLQTAVSLPSGGRPCGPTFTVHPCVKG